MGKRTKAQVPYPVNATKDFDHRVAAMASLRSEHLLSGLLTGSMPSIRPGTTNSVACPGRLDFLSEDGHPLQHTRQQQLG